ncbi:MAG: ABC transporter ATP-binding protein [Gemmataceae bacterium]
MLSIRQVSKRYPHRRGYVTALEDITLEVTQGDFLAVVGPSGSGKSTLLFTIGGMLSPSAGKVWVDGQSCYDLPVSQRTRLRRDKIGFVFQSFHLIPYLTALENVQVPLYLQGLSEIEQRRRAVSLLDRVGLWDRLDHKPCELSIGQQQRVALARTLANDPPLILADEPTGNLDPDTRRHVVSFLEELHREGRTIVLVTHDPHVAQRARRVARLVNGRLESATEQSPAIAQVA